MPSMRTHYVVDGHEFPEPESNLTGDGKHAPFYVFRVDTQAYLPGAYATRHQAEAVADTLNSAAWEA
jgi:hypothetical protein